MSMGRACPQGCSAADSTPSKNSVPWYRTPGSSGTLVAADKWVLWTAETDGSSINWGGNDADSRKEIIRFL